MGMAVESHYGAGVGWAGGVIGWVCGRTRVGVGGYRGGWDSHYVGVGSLYSEGGWGGNPLRWVWVSGMGGGRGFAENVFVMILYSHDFWFPTTSGSRKQVYAEPQ